MGKTEFSNNFSRGLIGSDININFNSARGVAKVGNFLNDQTSLYIRRNSNETKLIEPGTIIVLNVDLSLELDLRKVLQELSTNLSKNTNEDFQRNFFIKNLPQ